MNTVAFSVVVVGSSLIYVAIVVMWACLLIPMWLRRHENETEVRSVDRFSQAMRILSRRTPPAADSRYLVMPRRPSTTTAPVADAAPEGPRTASTSDGASVSGVLSRATAPAAAVRRHFAGRLEARRSVRFRPPTRHSGRNRLIARRRRLLVGLVALAGLLFVLALAGTVSWWWQGVADLALLALVAHLRAEAKRTAELDRRRRLAHARRAGTSTPVDAPAAPTVPVPAPAYAEQVAAVAGTYVIDEDTWEPVPVPVPTYVNAPVAERAQPPLIDLTRPGVWSDAQVDDGVFFEDEDAELFDQMTAEDDTLDVIVERRRAVND